MSTPEKPRYRDPATVQEAELRSALEAHRFEPKGAAQALGVSRTTIYDLIKKAPGLRTASELEKAEIERALELTGSGIRAAAESLEVSERALRLRMKKLDLS